jgi:type II secretory pathway component GspD/PulD (secretin)
MTHPCAFVFKTLPIPLACTALCLFLTGCMTPARINSEVNQKIQTATQPLAANAITRSNAPMGKLVEVADAKRQVSLDLVNANAHETIKALAQKAGYSLQVLQGVNTAATVSMSTTAGSPVVAIRQVAWMAGLVAVVNPQEKTVTLAQEATVTFRIPAEDIKKGVTTAFNYGGSALGSGSSGGGSSSGGSSASGQSFSPVKSEFTVSGGYGGTAPTAFLTYLQSLAGTNARVQVYLDAGLVTVRGNATALKRVHDFLSRWDVEARRQIEVNARVVEVSLTDEMRHGISWDRVIGAANDSKTLHYGISQASPANPLAATLTLKGATATTVIEALEALTTVEVTSTPHMTIQNNSAGVMFEGSQKPYMPTVTQSVTNTGTGANTSVSGTGAYASDGIQLSVHASILDDDQAVLTVMPTSVTLGDLYSFLDDRVKMYEQTVRTSGQRISIRSDETVVISSNRYVKSTGKTSGLPGLVNMPWIGKATGSNAQNQANRQTLLLLNARILPAVPSNIIYSESL